jgi:cholesterol transport system auxiliary component
MMSSQQYGACAGKNVFKRRRCCEAIGFALWSLSVVTGCGSILPKAPEQPTLYILDGITTDTTAGLRTGNADGKRAGFNAQLPAMTISTPIAGAGFGGIHIIYQRKEHELEHFALSQWVDTPAQMLAPLIVRAVESSGAFRGVVRGSTAAVSDFRLDTEIVRLQQNFVTTPSETRLTLRAVLVNTATRRIVAAREFDASVASVSEDTRGGVAAANAAVRQVLAGLTKFCAEAITQ